MSDVDAEEVYDEKPRLASHKAASAAKWVDEVGVSLVVLASHQANRRVNLAVKKCVLLFFEHRDPSFHPG